MDPDKRVFTTDVGISSLWLSPKMKRFLQDIGFIEINVSLFLRSGNPYEQLQNATGELISTCLSMYEDGKLMMSQLTLRKVSTAFESPFFFYLLYEELWKYSSR